MLSPLFFSETLSETKWRRTTLFIGIGDLSFVPKLSTRARTRAKCVLAGAVALLVKRVGRPYIFASIGFAHAGTSAPRRPVSDVYHPAAAAWHAPHSNTTAERTNTSTKVCVMLEFSAELMVSPYFLLISCCVTPRQEMYFCVKRFSRS